ncbi:MAG: hypothetical protein AMJ46_05825 [Latescibacteria bacterium DG_63]|nr:MAG: hypothetical protein AMJ46_05825 [Latescibacteria bacterium DG_63]
MRVRLSLMFVLAALFLWTTGSVSQPAEPASPAEPLPPAEPVSAAEVYENAMELVEKGEYRDALGLLQIVVADSANFADAYYNLGFIFERLEAADSARMAYEAALSLDSTLVMAHYGLGTLSLRGAEYDVAVTHLRKAVGYDPSFAGAYLNLGTALEATNDLDGAIVSLQKATELRPDYTDAYYQLAATKYRKAASSSDYPGVIEVYEKAVELDPQHVNVSVAYFYLARMYLATKQYDMAVAAADNAVKVRPDLAQACFVKGKALVALGKNEEAIEAYKEAIEKKTPYGSAHYALARLYQSTEQYKLALEEYKAAAEDESFPGAENAQKAAKSIEDYLKKKAESGG